MSGTLPSGSPWGVGNNDSSLPPQPSLSPRALSIHDFPDDDILSCVEVLQGLNIIHPTFAINPINEERKQTISLLLQDAIIQFIDLLMRGLENRLSYPFDSDAYTFAQTEVRQVANTLLLLLRYVHLAATPNLLPSPNPVMDHTTTHDVAIIPIELHKSATEDDRDQSWIEILRESLFVPQSLDTRTIQIKIYFTPGPNNPATTDIGMEYIEMLVLLGNNTVSVHLHGVTDTIVIPICVP